MQMNQLSQQSMMNSSLHSLRPSLHSPLYGTYSSYSLSYNFDITETDAIQNDPNAVVTLVLTLGDDSESRIREFVKLYRDTELSKKTIRMCLRFEKEPSRRILNYCKLNCPNVDVFTCEDQSVFDFLQTRGNLFTPTVTDPSVDVQDIDFYVMCFDFSKTQKEDIFDLLLQHTLGEWKYCLQLFQNNRDVRSVGLFPSSSSTDSETSDFWFDTFWIKMEPSTILSSLEKTEKLETLFCSKNSWFVSQSQIEDAKFVYDLSTFACVTDKIQENDSTNTIGVKYPSVAKTVSTPTRSAKVSVIPPTKGQPPSRRGTSIPMTIEEQVAVRSSIEQQRQQPPPVQVQETVVVKNVPSDAPNMVVM